MNLLQVIEVYHILKKEIEKHLKNKSFFNGNIAELEHKNLLLSENLNFDFNDILMREKLKFGNKKEILIKLND